MIVEDAADPEPAQTTRQEADFLRQTGIKVYGIGPAYLNACELRRSRKNGAAGASLQDGSEVRFPRLFRGVAHTLPSTATIDGVLGLDYPGSCRQVIDFNERWLSLERSE
jgi:hypothetical protein